MLNVNEDSDTVVLFSPLNLNLTAQKNLNNDSARSYLVSHNFHKMLLVVKFFGTSVENTLDQGQEKNTSFALVLACNIYNLPVHPLYNLESTRGLELFHSGTVLGILAVCPGNLP